MEQCCSNEKKCICPCHCQAAMPVLLIVIGLAFLGQNFGWWSHDSVAIIWPVALILIGVKKMMKGCKCCGKCKKGEASCCQTPKS